MSKITRGRAGSATSTLVCTRREGEIEAVAQAVGEIELGGREDDVRIINADHFANGWALVATAGFSATRKPVVLNHCCKSQQEPGFVGPGSCGHLVNDLRATFAEACIETPPQLGIPKPACRFGFTI